MERKETSLRKKIVLLGIDLEEFDLPLEYGLTLDPEVQVAVSEYGLRIIEKLLAKFDIAATFFTTGWWAEQRPSRLNRLAASHEIASHTLHHSRFEPKDLVRSRRILQSISGQPVTGIRMPRMGPVSDRDLEEAGFEYNSSSHPTFIPGRYNHFRAERNIFTRGNLIQLPVSVSPRLRIPVFWLAFRHLPYWYYRFLCRQILSADGYLVLYFHPWEFVGLKRFGLPWHLRRGSGEPLTDRFTRLLSDLGREAEFMTHHDFIKQYRENTNVFSETAID